MFSAAGSSGPRGVRRHEALARRDGTLYLVTCNRCRGACAVIAGLCIFCATATSGAHTATERHGPGTAAIHAQGPGIREQVPAVPLVVREFDELPHPPHHEAVKPPGARAEQFPPSPSVPIVPQFVRSARPPLVGMPRRSRIFSPVPAARVPVPAVQLVCRRQPLPPMPSSRIARPVPVA
jgi:hypothetical protein